MKRRALLVFAVLLGVAAWAAAQVPKDEASVPRITVADLKKAMAAGTVLVVDTRDPQSFADGHLPGAIVVALNDIPGKAGELKAAKKAIVTYCS